MYRIRAKCATLQWQSQMHGKCVPLRKIKQKRHGKRSKETIINERMLCGGGGSAYRMERWRRRRERAKKTTKQCTVCTVNEHE